MGLWSRIIRRVQMAKALALTDQLCLASNWIEKALYFKIAIIYTRTKNLSGQYVVSAVVKQSSIHFYTLVCEFILPLRAVLLLVIIYLRLHQFFRSLTLQYQNDHLCEQLYPFN